jgi:hypothetical protein
MTKIGGSGFISQRHGAADPDPHQNVMDPGNTEVRIVKLGGVIYISVWIIITGLADVKLVPVINYPPT